MDFDQPPVVRVSQARRARRWPPASGHGPSPRSTQLLREGLTLDKGVTFLVGENGSGKSTIVEAVAMAFGLVAEGGSTQQPALHPADGVTAGLGRCDCSAGSGRRRWGFFLRAETMHGWYTYLEEHAGQRTIRSSTR